MTRREQFLERWDRYRRRARRRRSGGWHYVLVEVTPGVFKWRHAGRKSPIDPGPLMYRGYLSKEAEKVHFLPGAGSFPVTFQISKIGKFLPPHVKFTGVLRAYFDARPHSHQREGIIGYFRRERFARRHKPGRMNGFERSCWGAAYVAVSSGFFPDWDPLHRHPTEDEVLAGDPPYSGDFPQTPRHQ